MAKSCSICGKSETVGYNRPRSLHCTKRIIKPNLQKKDKQLVCTRCLRTQNKKS